MENDRYITMETGLGSIKGLRTAEGREFLGVRFAMAGRFKYAQPVNSWEGTYDATQIGPACPQIREFHAHLENPERMFYQREFREGIDFVYDEDCLNLNIYTPAEAEGCPVIIFIHGGGFDSGCNCQQPFNGSEYSKKGVVTVFINYRVGVLGYLTNSAIQERFGRDGNFGLDDQLLAIKWVKEHIADFGGDPENITLLGQSAGAISIQYLCLMQENKGLFQRAAMMSGGGMFPKFALPKKAEDTHSYWEGYMNTAGCSSLEELKKLGKKGLMDALEAYKQTRKDNMYNTMPVVDGCLLKAPVDTLIDHPLDLDYMIGYTNTDMYAPVMGWIGNKFGKKNDAYIYFFDIDSPGDNNGAFHSSDLRYMFGKLAESWRPYGERDYEVSGQLMGYMANFAKRGDPNGPGLPKWQPCRGGKRRVLCFKPSGTAMGGTPYLRMTRNMLTKGDPKA